MSEPYIGQIFLFAGNFPIRNYANCEGQLLNISQNQALFSILGTTYGGDGRTTFALPDLRGRIAMQPGNGPGLPSYQLGQKGGNFQTNLNINQLPAHTHTFAPPCENTSEGNTHDPGNNFPGIFGDKDNIYNTQHNATMGGGNTGSTGNGNAVSLQNPFLGINFQIALVGVFPPRS